MQDVKGYDDHRGAENKLLENFIKQMNKKPIQLVNEFLMSAKLSKDACRANDKTTEEEKGYLFRCNETLQMCCRHPFQKECTLSSCFPNYRSS